jgi:predicted permease
VGDTLKLNGHAFTVVGVAAPGFHGVEVGSSPDLYVPLMMKAAITPTWNELENRRFFWLNVMARLKPGVSRVQAQAGLQVLYRQINEQELTEMHDAPARFRERYVAKQIQVLPGFRGLSSMRQQFTTSLLVLMAMVGLVLLIACANVANLLLARAASREREIAVRLALGARRGQIVRQLLVESLVLSALGGVAGLVLSSWVGDALLRALPFEQAGRSLSGAPDGRVLLFTLAVSLSTGLVFGLVPAWQATRPRLTAALKEESGIVSGSSHVRFRKGLVVAQVALSLLLLIGAGLFARSLYNLRSLDPGFAAQRLLTLTVDPSLNGYAPERMRPFFRQLQERFGAVPSVTAASFAAEPIMAAHPGFRRHQRQARPGTWIGRARIDSPA